MEKKAGSGKRETGGAAGGGHHEVMVLVLKAVGEGEGEVGQQPRALALGLDHGVGERALLYHVVV